MPHEHSLINTVVVTYDEGRVSKVIQKHQQWMNKQHLCIQPIPGPTVFPVQQSLFKDRTSQPSSYPQHHDLSVIEVMVIFNIEGQTLICLLLNRSFVIWQFRFRRCMHSHSGIASNAGLFSDTTKITMILDTVIINGIQHMPICAMHELFRCTTFFLLMDLFS